MTDEPKSIKQAVNNSPYAITVGGNFTQNITFQNAPAQPNIVKIHYLPEQITNLIGRKTIVAELLTAVSQPQGSSYLLLNGMGGVGKTAICQQLAHRASSALNTVIWLNCQVGLDNELQTVAQAEFDIDIKQTNWATTLHKAMKQRPQPALLILDNLEADSEGGPNTAQLLRQLKTLNWHLLATSRELLPEFSRNIYSVNPLDLLDCVELFKTNYQPMVVSPTDMNTLLDLLALACHHTLTIELLAKIASDEALTIDVLYQQVKASGFDLTELTQVTVHGDHSGTATHHDHQQQLHQHLSKLFQLAKLPPDEAQVLRLLAIFPSQPYQINQELKPWFNQTSAALFNQLSKKGWLQRTEQHFTLHPVIAHVAKNEITLSPTALDNFARHFYNAIQPTTTEHWISKTPYITLLIPLLDLLSDNDKATPYLSNTLALIYKYKGDYPPALPLFQRALAIREQTLGPDHPAVANSLNNLAEHYRTMGDYPPALPLFQRALAICEQALGPDHPDVAASLNNLAGLYDDLGDYLQALPLYQRALTIRQQTLGPDHPAVAQSLNNLAGLYEDMGDNPQALPLYQRALAIKEQALGPDHPAVATSLNNLAALYQAMGDYPPALLLYQRALAIDEQALGPDHPNVATSLNNLASLYYATGDYPQALPLYQRAVAILERSLGINHPNYKMGKNNLDDLTAKMA